ncbi:MAG: rod shape-determining protein MreC [Deltaproteobacteria bacterium]|nr:rod shape-determining protein MreC [Deltaproteobacteria bacterium]MBI3388855.1 rod shape-determining protein MreC [Deltaproteobacteria bacterium]
MLEFVRRNRIILTSGFLLLFSLLLVSTSVRAPRRRDPLTALLLEAMRPLQVGVSDAGSALTAVWNHYVELVGVRAENEALRARVRELEQHANRLGEIEESNQHLKELLGFRSTLDGQTVNAQISGRDPGALFQSLTIDKGEHDGVSKGFAVLSPDGVVGQVVATSAHAARVLLVTDHNSGVDAVVQRSRARGIVAGALADGCVMKYLQRGEDVAVGDRVTTSGLDGIFPKGVLIGEVTKVSRNHRGLLQLAEVRPSAALERLEDVLVVAPGAHVNEPTNGDS